MTFTIPGPFLDSTPFEAMHVWHWAKGQSRVNVNIGNYLESLGFVVGMDRLTEDQYKRIDYAIDCFHRIAPRIHSPMCFDDCLTQTTAGGFYVVGKPGRYALSQVIIDALTAAGWIYDVNPQTTYLEVINGRLFAKYQQIIGSRCIVEITQ